MALKMELPDKIYVDTPNHDFWYRTKDKNSIEYTRTDAFIEKACKWLEDNFYLYINSIGGMIYCNVVDLIHDFKKAMEE